MTELLTAAAGAAAASVPRPMMDVENAHVTYRVYASGKRISGRDNNLFSINALRGGRGLKTVPALRGVTFTAHEGETIGVIGHNGSGKSTLFRAMSGLIPTSEGIIRAAARPVLLGVNAALVPELSGESNIRLGLLAMGFSPEEAGARVGEIADFAELNDFIHHPMRTYSSGMGARLKFAIASAKAHSILLIDEALAVGDRKFKQKSERRIRELRDSAGLVMIVSHSTGSLRGTCDRVLWVHKGELRADGPSKDVIDEYTKWSKNPSSQAVGAASAASARPKSTGTTSRPAAAGSGGKVRGDQKAAATGESTRDTSLLEEVLAEAGIPTSVASVQGPAPDRGPRDAARRERYRETARQRHRRRLVGTLVTGGAILLAVAAGAGIALAANLTATGGHRVSTPTAAPTEVDSSALPVIRSFKADEKTATCTSEDETTKVKLSWKVEDALFVAVVKGSAKAEEADLNPTTALLATRKDYAMAFDCADEKHAYTLVAENTDGTRVSSVVTIARELEEPEAPPERPVQPAPPVNQPAPEQPAPPVDDEPTAPPKQKPTPTTRPTQPPPTQQPDPSPTSEAPDTDEPSPGAETPDDQGAADQGGSDDDGSDSGEGTSSGEATS